ncbi:MAG: PQQ-binding-like beta-propeller repeat protein, partial [Thermoproteota archaeon]
YLYALNPDGTLKWKYQTGGYVYSSPSIGSDGTIYFGSYDSHLYALNPDGTLKWKYKTGDYVYSSPAIGSDGTIYFGSGDGCLYAIGLARASSTITCVLSSSSIAYGGSVRISGRISPPASATVTIQYSTDGEAWINLASVTSGDDGSYSYTWSSIPVGNYFVKASWPGNDDYQGATSSIASLTVSKASPTITLQAAKATLNKGERIEVSGSTNPPLASINLVLTYEKPDGARVNHTVQTDSNGVFSDSIDADTVGDWIIKASWTGSAEYNAATSNTLTVTVSQPAETPLPTTIITAITIVAAAIILALVLKRRPKPPPPPPPPPPP